MVDMMVAMWVAHSVVRWAGQKAASTVVMWVGQTDTSTAAHSVVR